MSHNQLVFGVLLAVVLGLCSFLLYRMFFTDSTEGHSAANVGLNDGADIEATLKKILSQTAGLAPAATAGATPTIGGAVATPEQVVEVENLRAEITANQNLIAELKAKAQSAAPGTDQTPELLKKIKTLEDRLAEYEIIEDDIADLSIYKEENAKLKKELEALKSGSGAVLKNDAATDAVDAMAAAVAAPVAQPAPAEVAAPPVAAAPTPVAPPEPAPAPAPAVEPVAPAPSAPATPTFALAPENEPVVSTTTTSTDNVKGSSDVFAEFQGEDTVDPLASLGDLDADRMLEEIKDLGEGSAGADVLNEDVDLEKMAKETSNKG